MIYSRFCNGCCSKSRWLVCFAPQILLPWSGARASQVHSDSANVASFLCRPSKCDCRVDKRRTKKAVADAPERTPSTLLAPLRAIFKAFPDLKPNWEAPSLSGWVKYFTATTCQLPSSVSSPDLPSFPAQMGLFPEAELPPGLWGPIASFNCQQNVSMFTANMIRIAFAFRVVFFCFSSSSWEAVGSQEKDFYKVLGLENQAVLLWVLPFHASIFTSPSLLPPYTPSSFSDVSRLNPLGLI